MKRHLGSSLLFLLAVVLAANGLVRAEAAGRSYIEHFPPATAQPGVDLPLEARIVNPPAPVRFVRIYYRPAGSAAFAHVEMRKQLDSYVGSIPGSDVKEPGIEYFILAVFNNGDLETHPPRDAHRSPHYVQVAPVEAGKAPAGKAEQGSEGFPGLILSPDPTEPVGEEEVVVAISITNPDTVDSASVHLFVDGKDVTTEAEISPYVITWSPVGPMAPGKHFVTLKANTKAGKPLPPFEFSFKVLGVKVRKEPFLREFRGRVFSELRQERVSKRDFSANIFGARASGMAGPVRFYADAYITSLERRDEQPRNRLSLSLHTRYIGVDFGDTYPRYGELTLWGQRVRGISGYVHLGFFNVDATLGELTRAVEGVAVPLAQDTSGSGSILVSNGDTLVLKRVGTYRRRLWAVRPSVGSGRHFQIGVTLMKVLDDTNSVRYGLKPKDNLVVSPDFLVQLMRGRLRVEGSAAFSMYTDDISRGVLTKAEIDSIFQRSVPIDPADYARYLIMNETTVPLDPRGMTSTAYQFKATFRFLRNDLRAGYRSVGPEYRTLANPFLRTNLRGFYVNDRIRLFQNMVYLNLGYEGYQESFAPDDDVPTLNRHAFNYGFSFYPSPGLPQISWQQRSYNRKNSVVAVDTTFFRFGYDPRINNSTRESVLSVSEQFRLFDREHRFNYTFSKSTRDDQFMGPLGDVDNRMHLLNWRSQIFGNWAATLNVVDTKNEAGYGHYLNSFKYQLLGGGLQRDLFGGYGLWRLESRYTKSKIYTVYEGTAKYGTVTQLTLGTGLELRWKRHFGFVDALLSSVTDLSAGTNTPAQKYTDWIIRARYEYRW